MRVNTLKAVLVFLCGTLIIQTMANGHCKTPNEDQRKKLTAQQFAVTQQCATEPAFSNQYWNHHEAGIYVDVVDGTPLFSSIDKFDSGTGWPSFTKPIDSAFVEYQEDQTLGITRTEVRSKIAKSHLGHVFPDGPGPNHKRYCMNSAALRFVSVENLQKEGYGKYLSLFPSFQAPMDKKQKMVPSSTAILAGGCFWGVQDLIRNIPGVIQTEVGYTGGSLKNPTYSDVKTGKTGHAEAIRIVFDPSIVSYEALLDKFFSLHDPTTLNQQGNDKGSQYRSAIFYENADQKERAEKKIKEWNSKGKWKKSIVTEITHAGPFYPAEAEHQDYLKKNPNGYSCHYYRTF